MFEQLIHSVVETVFAMGYPGILILMTIESSFIPFPSELVVPPAGYLAAQGRLDPFVVLLAALSGSVLGALFNYWAARTIGEPVLRRFGRYVLLSEKGFDRAAAFFHRHGEISTFVGRLIPVVRQLISVPAGLARMRLVPFIAWTALGAGIWCTILLYIGWLLGRHETVLREAAVHAYTTRALVVIIPILALVILGYVLWRRRQHR